MAKARKKSYNDIDNQFVRIWHTGIENTDTYKAAKKELEESAAQATSPQVRAWRESDLENSAFRIADDRLRNSKNLSAKDKIINERINRASRTAGRYLEGIRKGSGFSDVTPFYETDRDRLKAYAEWKKKKYSYARRAGISG